MDASSNHEVENGYQPPSRHRLPLRISERRSLLLVVDVALVNVAVLIGLWIWTLGYEGVDFSAEFVLGQAYWFPVLSALWLVSSVLNSFYDAAVTNSIRSISRALLQLCGLLTHVQGANSQMSVPLYH